MRGMAESGRTDSRGSQLALPKRSATRSASGLDSTFLMPAGSLLIPRFDRVPSQQHLWLGERAAARLAHTLLDAGVANADDWTAANHNPFDFLKRGLERWLTQHGESVIDEQFSLDLILSTTLDRYHESDPKSNDVSRVFLSLEPDSAGYVILGPTLRLLETIHRRLLRHFSTYSVARLTPGCVSTIIVMRWIGLSDFGIGMRTNLRAIRLKCPTSIDAFPNH